MQPDEYATMFRVEETHWWYQALHRLIFENLEGELPDWRRKTILDAGCGTGAILKRLGNPEKNVGVDVAPLAVAFCRQRGLTNVFEGDISDLPFADSSFDAVICSSVLYHEWVRNLQDALREIHRVLRPDGLFLANVPAFRFLHSAHDAAVMTARRFRRNELCRLLIENGFAVRRLTYWTTLLLPVAILARTLNWSKTGRDFPEVGTSYGLTDRVFSKMMALELDLLKKFSMPVGVALLAIAKSKRVGGRGET